jgi:hypothetical protein
VKLGFGEVLSESFEFFFARLPLFFHLVTVPWILSLLLRIAGAAWTEESLPIVLAEKGARCHSDGDVHGRLDARGAAGPGSVGRLPGLAWSPRETPSWPIS